MSEHESLMAAEELVPSLAEHAEKMRTERDDALDLLRDIANSGVSFDDERVGYVEVQIDRETWRALARYRREGEAT